MDEVAVMDALHVTDEFVEVEIELRDGDPARLDEIAKEVRRAGATPAPDCRSSSARSDSAESRRCRRSRSTRCVRCCR